MFHLCTAADMPMCQSLRFGLLCFTVLFIQHAQWPFAPSIQYYIQENRRCVYRSHASTVRIHKGFQFGVISLCYLCQKTTNDRKENNSGLPKNRIDLVLSLSLSMRRGFFSLEFDSRSISSSVTASSYSPSSSFRELCRFRFVLLFLNEIYYLIKNDFLYFIQHRDPIDRVPYGK